MAALHAAAASDVSPAVGEVAGCPDCFGHSEPCRACVAAAGDPEPGEFTLGPGVEQVRRCACGRVYGAYHAGRALCFLMQAPGRRQVERCMRCGQQLTRQAMTDCTPALGSARHVAPRSYDLAAVCRERAIVCPASDARCESIACIDVGCTAEDANLDAERAA